jgi:small subunit ribosomal protein S3Ae
MAYNKKYADWSKKVWVDIYAPVEIFNENKIGETPANKDDVEEIIGRSVDLNLAFILNNFKYQNYKVIFQINKISGLKAYTEVKDIMLYPSYIRRITKKGTSKIEDSFIVKTNDGYEVKIKPLVITRFKAHRSQRAEIRKTYRKYLEEKVSSLKYYELIENVIHYDLQNEIKPALNKIFPVSNVEIRRITKISQIKQEVPQTVENK